MLTKICFSSLLILPLMLTHNSILTDEQLYDLCLEAAKTHAFWEGLAPYERQALQHYAKERIAQLSTYTEDRQQYEILIFPIYNAAKKLLSLSISSDDVAATVTDEWEGLLQNNFTIDDLHRLVFELGLINNTVEKEPSSDIKSAHWIGLREGLIRRKRLKNNNTKFYRALTNSYGEVGSLSAFQRPYNEKNEDSHNVAESVKARISKI